MTGPPINAQYALDLIFKTLVDDKERYPYLTTMSESVEQINGITLHLFAQKIQQKIQKTLQREAKV